MDKYIVRGGVGAMRVLTRTHPGKAEVRQMLRDACKRGDAGPDGAEAFATLTHTGRVRDMRRQQLYMIDITALLREKDANSFRDTFAARRGPGALYTWNDYFWDALGHTVARLVNAHCAVLLLHDVRVYQFAGKGQEQALRDASRTTHVDRLTPPSPRPGFHCEPFAPPSDDGEVPHWDLYLTLHGRTASREAFEYMWAKLTAMAYDGADAVFVLGDGVLSDRSRDVREGRIPQVIVRESPADPVEVLRLPQWRHWVGEVDQLWVAYFLWLGIGANTLVHTNDTDAIPHAILAMDRLYNDIGHAPVFGADWVEPWGGRGAHAYAASRAHLARADAPDIVRRVLALFGLSEHLPRDKSALRALVSRTDLVIEMRASGAGTHKRKNVKVSEADAPLVRSGMPVGSFVPSSAYDHLVPHGKKRTHADADDDDPNKTRAVAAPAGGDLVTVRVDVDAWDPDRTLVVEHVRAVALYTAVHNVMRATARVLDDATCTARDLVVSFALVVGSMRGTDYTGALLQAVTMSRMADAFMELVAHKDKWRSVVGAGALAAYNTTTHMWVAREDAVLRFLAYTYRVRHTAQSADDVCDRIAAYTRDGTGTVDMWNALTAAAAAKYPSPARKSWLPAPLGIALAEMRRINVALALVQGPMAALDTRSALFPLIPNPLVNGWTALAWDDGCVRVHRMAEQNKDDKGKRVQGYEGRTVTLAHVHSADARWNIKTLVPTAALYE